MEAEAIIPPADPWALFREWYELAEKHEPGDPNAMALATVGRDGLPSVRMVLFKMLDERGIMFLTNTESRKGEQLKENPQAGLSFHWKSIRKQVRMEGPVAPIDAAEADAYFATRPRESRIGAWVSQQSRALESYAALGKAVAVQEKKFEGKDVPRPSYWSGYRIAPLTMEFWAERPYRLHERVTYRRKSPQAPWVIERLYP